VTVSTILALVTLDDLTLKVAFLFVSYHKASALLIATTVSTVLALVTLDDTILKVAFQFVSYHPGYPRQM
jgi:hypothetical protein